MMISPFPIKDNPEITILVLDKSGLAFIIVHHSSFVIRHSSFIIPPSSFVIRNS